VIVFVGDFVDSWHNQVVEFVVGGVYFFVIHYRKDLRELLWTCQGLSNPRRKIDVAAAIELAKQSNSFLDSLPQDRAFAILPVVTDC
jgi:hypothetical protein